MNNELNFDDQINKFIQIQFKWCVEFVEDNAQQFVESHMCHMRQYSPKIGVAGRMAASERSWT